MYLLTTDLFFLLVDLFFFSFFPPVFPQLQEKESF